MTLNTTKSTAVIFPPHRTARRVLITLPNFMLSDVALNVVDNNCKYLGDIIFSVNDDDNQGIAQQMSLICWS